MGSTFKIFSLAAGFEYADIQLNSSFDVGKPLVISRYTIKDYHPQNRVLSTIEVFLKSSNSALFISFLYRNIFFLIMDMDLGKFFVYHLNLLLIRYSNLYLHLSLIHI